MTNEEKCGVRMNGEGGCRGGTGIRKCRWDGGGEGRLPVVKYIQC